MHKTIYELETSLLEPGIRSSFEKLNNLISDDFKEFGSSGLVYNKQNILERLPSNTDKTVYSVSDFEIVHLSENIIMSHFKTERIINNTNKSSSLRTSLWRNENGVWKIFFHQGTITK